ncbi:MAG: DNA integrity scanning protein DisA [Limnochordaceae bacterium]|nr:DNA integrity scanning protein DisA [Limnochordaceae bacterium]
MPDEKNTDPLLRALRLVAPGTVLYEGLENVLRARTGALIVIGDSPEVLELVDGGFRIDADLTPQALYELAKMDGAIVLSSDAKKILFANTQLQPDPMIPTDETGTRHRTAERVARQTGQLVISISQRRNVITLYQGNWKYLLPETSLLLTKANQALQTLEKFRIALDQSLTNLNALEFENLASLGDVLTVISRAGMVAKIVREIDRYIAQLGTEGHLIQLQKEETLGDVLMEARLVIRDYCIIEGDRTPEQVQQQVDALSAEELVDLLKLARLLGYTAANVDLDRPLTPRGYRLLSKIPRLPMPVIDNLVRKFVQLPQTLSASVEQLDEVDGIGEVRAKAIKDGLRRLHEQAMLERHL